MFVLFFCIDYLLVQKMGISRFGLYPALKLSLTVSAGLPLGYLHRSQASTNLEDNIYTKFYELQRSLYPT